MLDKVLDLVQKHEAYRSSCVNLIASENVVSDQVKRALGSDLAGRYVAYPKFYGGTRFMDEAWSLTEERACRVFRAKYASVNPIGGHIALMATLTTLCRPGATVASIPPEYGGYGGLAREHSMASMLGLRADYLPYDGEGYNLNTEKSLEYIAQNKPKVVVLGSSVILFPQPVREVAEEVHRYGGSLVYDGSHVMGLIAGGVFQDPLREGADVLVGSTHKSFFGPQGGLILSNDSEFMAKLSSNFLHVTQDNPHPNRVAALGVALAEAEKWGAQYASRVVLNSKRLAKLLFEEGLPVTPNTRGDFTQSHQVFLNYGGWEKGSDVRDKLEEVRIIVDAGVRVGLNEVTRRGYDEVDIESLAHAIALKLKGHEANTDILKIVDELVEKHPRIHYTL
ncbi:hypothetical protein B9Q03_06090 [Candidatus Marsarchaeota G2 archaeon OSP_D]|jgi:Glycine/serine hydroxymethyltransferase|uniref:Serine hydroxymethyltransferase-like domain-containing protein n=5 Tax=Candidatus Marsarchaeota group 2 TaxID=2203771 RepID=A0A2R6B5Z8_9ARCH|nr:MAG: hypothetical protein B9Q03_06090 [Candidatus Marsarchaeota G2 archaeon OSP_D]PSN94097.1 MAG: hypothetical protein B9Q06_10425 [Candidatus Marsarchaeota G2 archaeon ECH_B_2]PSN98529.1 MAG: hypothetical protein B9Q07_09320 [Candidatus Marsarchaeota G2 archaeon ECH_B_3]PSO00248.1 MAG: hypothetical protein B9Q05_10610 [Candidatus Marsarchaeota G2 archaeon ECH_B_1]